MKAENPTAKVQIGELVFSADAVSVEDLGSQASLTVQYKTIDRLGREESDTIRFFAPFGGRFESSKTDAVRDCIAQAWQWAKFERLSGFEVSAWDDCGNCF